MAAGENGIALLQLAHYCPHQGSIACINKATIGHWEASRQRRGFNTMGKAMITVQRLMVGMSRPRARAHQRMGSWILRVARVTWELAQKTVLSESVFRSRSRSRSREVGRVSALWEHEKGGKAPKGAGERGSASQRHSHPSSGFKGGNRILGPPALTAHLTGEPLEPTVIRAFSQRSRHAELLRKRLRPPSPRLDAVRSLHARQSSRPWPDPTSHFPRLSRRHCIT